MADVNALEKQLNEIFGKQAPQMPDGGKKFLVKWAHIFVLVGGFVSLFFAWGLWIASHAVNRLVDYANELSKAYGSGQTVSTASMTVWVWLALALLAVEAVLYFMAYAPLKAHAKKGWNLLFYVSLLGVAYSIISLFIRDRGVGSFLLGLVGTAIGWWILFQIRPSYLDKKAPSASEKSPTKK